MLVQTWPSLQSSVQNKQKKCVKVHNQNISENYVPIICLIRLYRETYFNISTLFIQKCLLCNKKCLIVQQMAVAPAWPAL